MLVAGVSAIEPTRAPDAASGGRRDALDECLCSGRVWAAGGVPRPACAVGARRAV